MDGASDARVAVIGLGYVGLPLAVALARKYPCIGFDIDEGRIRELGENHDRTAEIEEEVLARSSLELTQDPDAVAPSEFYIVTVPTPIDAARNPDLSILKAASRSVGTMLARAGKERGSARKPVVIYESTVFPGATEEICAPILEEVSGLRRGEDFFVGYSPERINPGDREHTIDKITKVVSGENAEVLGRISALYGSITQGGTFEAASIKAAEAAKVIENAQRDINIAFMNEIAQIFARMDLSVWDVLDAARTKWNFLPFSPGLVGGHCIGVDPYYLSHRAEQLGHDPRVILSGRSVNDSMANWVARSIHAARDNEAGSLLVMGLTFKENVPDLRNSKVADLAADLAFFGHDVTVHDPLADPAEAKHEYGIELDPDALSRPYDMVLLAVPHGQYLAMGIDRLRDLVASGGTFGDLKGVLKGALCEASDWTL
ncbi:MAG: nucleotide sugar dehydrogenase [Erythrobacter sp.]